MAASKWSARVRNYSREYDRRWLPREETTDHPLKSTSVEVMDGHLSKRKHSGTTTSSANSSMPSTPKRTVADPLSIALDGVDPLSQFAFEEVCDPLTRMAADDQQHSKNSVPVQNDGGVPKDSWASHKLNILCKYTTSEKLSIATSFLPGGEKVAVKTQTSITDKVKHHLEQLDDFEDGSVREMQDLSQQEYVQRIDQLNHELIHAWEQDQRVKALKIVIQCSKLLIDTSVMQFYPSKFVLITDILDTFGTLVYERLKTKTEFHKSGTPLRDNFSPSAVPLSAKETCRNWFYKIASIRELLPRLYVEMAILRSYSYLTQDEFPMILTRITQTICGLGDPLVAAYARCYLCRVGTAVVPKERDYLHLNLTCFAAAYKQLTSNDVRAELSKQSVNMATYLSLYSPALNWIMHCIAFEAPESLMIEIFNRYKHQCNSSLLLNSVLSAFQPEHIAVCALNLIETISSANEEGFPHHILFLTFGHCIVAADPPESHRLQLLNEVWNYVTRLQKPAHYIGCAEVWVDYITKHFGHREINTFLADVIKHMVPERAFESHYSQLQTIMDKIIKNISDFKVFFSMDKLLPFIDMFQKEYIKTEVCKNIMDSFNRLHTETTSDLVLINALMYICQVLHDSVNALVVEDEKRQIGSLIAGFIQKVDFGRDFEHQLSFYMEARAAFTNLDVVIIHLIHKVNFLAIATRSVVKGHHTRKTAAFVRACTAYCYITLPSLLKINTQLELYLLSGHVALLNQCLTQADACFKAAINLLPNVSKTIDVDGKSRSSDPYIMSFVCNFLSTLLIVPDSPEQPVLYLARGCLNVLQSESSQIAIAIRPTLYIRVLQFLSAAVQVEYPYHIEKVDSNDALYGCDPVYVAEVAALASTVLDELLVHLKQLGDLGQHKQQTALAYELFTHIVTYSDPTYEILGSLAVNLWNLAHKYGEPSGNLDAKLLKYLKTRHDLHHMAGKLQLWSRS